MSHREARREDPAPGRAARPRLLDSVDYRRWWTGTLASSIGAQVALIANPLMILLLTGSPSQAGFVGAVGSLPFVVLSIPVGVLVDRVPRRSLLFRASIVSALAVGSIPISFWLGTLTSAHLYAVAVLGGIAAVVLTIAQTPVLPSIVPRGHLAAATSQAEAIERLAAVVGPPLGGMLFQRVSPGAPFAVNAVSLALFAGCVMRIRSSLDAGAEAPSALAWREHVRAGVRAIFGRPLLRALTLLNTAGDFLFSGIGLLMIVLTMEAGATATVTGIVFGLASAGGLAGALSAQRIVDRLGMSYAVIGKHVLTALIFPALLLDLPALVMGVLWGLISFQVSIVGVVQRAHLVQVIDSRELGRAYSVATFLSFGSMPLGIAGTGLLLEWGGGQGTVWVYSGALVLLAVYSLASRAIRRAHRPLTEEEGNLPLEIKDV